MSYQPRKPKSATEKPPRKYAIKEITLSDGTVIGIFEGSRGANPDHDILIKYKDKFTKTSVPRTPKHIHWVVDLLIKKEHDRDLTLNFMRHLRGVYDRVEAFKSKEERANFMLKEVTSDNLKSFEELNKYGEYKVEFIMSLIELMIKMEKNHPNPHVFRELIEAMINNKEIFVTVSRATQVR